MKTTRWLCAGFVLLAFAVATGLWYPLKAQQNAVQAAPTYTVDPFWPKPLPAPNGHHWVTGEVGGSCTDSYDHVITVNRGWQSNFSTMPPGPNQLQNTEGDASIPSPPVIEYDQNGNVVNAWGDTSKTPFKGSSNGPSAVLPEGIHGCFVDYQDNIWIAGNADGVVQKWSHDGKTMLLQIGEKGHCDGPPTLSPTAPYSTCGSPGNNSSQTLLNKPADIAVDPNPDPQTHQPGSVYIADGYGNHRIIVFDAHGKFLRQWGSAGTGPGQFAPPDGGHPHCVVLGNDGLVYTCDRGNNRIEVFDKIGKLQRIIPVVDTSTPPSATLPDLTPATALLGTNRACDLDFSPDKAQSLIFDTSLGNDVVWILDRQLGQIIGHFGRAGHQCGEFSYAHTVNTDSKGNLYVAETINGHRIQKFVRQGPSAQGGSSPK